MGTSLVSNPPYNMKWEVPSFAQIQSRFSEYGLPPESNANYAFILTALDLISDKAVFLLPCGVLTTENAQEKEIRKHFVEKNMVEAVIACPDKMFEATDIPTCIMVLNKKKKTTGISFVDMRYTYEVEERRQNGQFGGSSHENRTYTKNVKVFADEHMQKAIDSIEKRLCIPGFSKTVSVQTVLENGYSLIPSRYIELQEQEAVHREYADIVADINRITAEKNACSLTINESLAKSLGFNITLYKTNQENSDLNGLLKQLGAEPIIRENYFTVSKNKNEIRFENKSKDILSSVLLMILNTWKQHIFYLNNEQNRYLAELRDALLPDLMSGRICLSQKGEGNEE